MLQNTFNAVRVRARIIFPRFFTPLHFFTKLHPFALIVLCICLLGLCSFGVFHALSAGQTIITLTAKGFSPDEVTIHPGDTVTFRTTMKRPFWPASNVHPTHTDYPAFDPKQPIAPDRSWSFTFPKEGVYGFHDHLQPQFLGVINVTDSATPLSIAEQCAKEADLATQKQCWDSEIRAAHAHGGMQASFDVFTNLYQTQPAFASDCHGYTHTLGSLAYSDYKYGKDFPLSKEVEYCSYGFFHGFIESLMEDTGDVSHIRDFCDFLSQKTQGQFSVTSPCVHGIGHGVTDGSDPRSFGNAQMIIDPGIVLCEHVGRNEYETEICASGVFDSLGAMFMAHEHGLSLDPNDPYAVCKAQKDMVIRQACYADFKSLILSLSKNDIRTAIGYVSGIEDTPQIKKSAMENIATIYVYSINGEDFSDAVNACHSIIEADLRQACIGGLAMGFINIGELNKEYVRGLHFCSSPQLYADELDSCYLNVLHSSRVRYPAETFLGICAAVPAALRSHGFYTECGNASSAG